MCKTAIASSGSPVALLCSKFYPNNGRTVIVVLPSYEIKSLMKKGLMIEMPRTVKLCIWALGWRECTNYDFDTHPVELPEGAVWMEMPS